MIVLVCGGRDYNNAERVFSVLDRIHQKYTIDTIVHGDANGADFMGSAWAINRGVKEIACPAAWEKHGKRAGPIRNQYMLDTYKPDLVVAFPGGNGTAHMKKIAEKDGVRVVEIE